MPETVFDRLVQLLTSRETEFDVTRHAPVYTSEQAAAVRGVPLCSGAKALICKADDRFAMVVIPADRRLASKQIREANGWRKLRFATREEVFALTGLAPGAIPPFGSLFSLTTFCDSGLADNTTIHFNAGDHTISIGMRAADYLQVEQPVVGAYAG